MLAPNARRWLHLLVLFVPLCLWSQSRDPEIAAVVKQIDELYRSTSSTGVMEMEIITPNWQRTLRMQVWTAGMDRTFIRILSPQKEKGVATLRIGNEMWNYLPNTGKVIKIPPSMMMSSWMGSDFTNDDLVGEFTLFDDFDFVRATPAGEPDSLLYIEFRPHEDLPIVWGKVLTAVRRHDYLPVWDRYYDEKGNLMRVIYFREIRSFGGRTIPSVMELIPRHKTGHKTVVRYLELRFDQKVDESIFSLRHLRSGS